MGLKAAWVALWAKPAKKAPQTPEENEMDIMCDVVVELLNNPEDWEEVPLTLDHASGIRLWMGMKSSVDYLCLWDHEEYGDGKKGSRPWTIQQKVRISDAVNKMLRNKRLAEGKPLDRMENAVGKLKSWQATDPKIAEIIDVL